MPTLEEFASAVSEVKERAQTKRRAPSIVPLGRATRQGGANANTAQQSR